MRSHSVLLAVLPLLLILPLLAADAPPAAEKGRIDSFGDPLPEGALVRLGTARFRIPSYSTVQLSPDGKWFAVNTTAGILLMDAATGKETKRIPVKGSIALFTFDPSSNRIAGAFYYTGAIQLWDVGSGKEVSKIATGEKGNPRALLLGDNVLVTVPQTSGGKMPYAAYDTSTGKKVATFEPLPAFTFTSARLSPDGKVLVTWGTTGLTGKKKPEERAKLNLTLQVWDVKSGKETRKIVVERDQGRTVTAAFSPDGQVLTVGTNDGALSFFDLKSGKRLRTVQGAPTLGSNLDYSPDGKLLVKGGFDGKFLLWDVKTGKRLRPPDGPRGYRFIDLAFSADGRALAAWRTGDVQVLADVRTGKLVSPLVGHVGRIEAVAFTRDGARLLTAGYDGNVMTWGLRGKERGQQVGPTYAFRNQTTEGCTFSPRMDYLARAAWSGGVQVMDLETGKEALSAWSNDFQGRSLAFRPDGKVLAVGRGYRGKDGSVERWDLASGEELPRINLPGKSVVGIALSPNGKHIAVAAHLLGAAFRAQKPELRLFDAATGKEVPTFKATDLSAFFGTVYLTYTPDGKYLVMRTTSDGYLRFYDPLSGAIVRRLSIANFPVPHPVFSPDGKMLACATHGPGQGNGLLALWEVATGRQRWEHVTQGAYAHALAFSPDGKMLATGYTDSTVLVWDVTGQAGAKAEARLEAGEAEKLWKALEVADAAAAFRAMQRLMAAPKDALVLLRKEMRPIADKGLGAAVLLRPMRAIEVLERIGSAEARALLAEIARGKGDAELTGEAKKALARLARGGKGDDKGR